MARKSSAEPTITPMMQQYRRARAELAGDVLLLFRMGDFYEMFFEDAVRGAQILDIVLTKRNGVPMAGIPHHALQGYLAKVLEAGVKVAIAEQMEDPKTAKGLVKREITQVITPGTIVEGAVLNAGRSNFLVCLCAGKKEQFGLASLDISTGEFRLTELQGREALEAELHRLQPAEVLLPEALNRLWEEAGYPDLGRRVAWTAGDDWTFDPGVTRDLLHRQFQVASLDGFGCRDLHLGVRAAGAVLHYAQHNLRRNAEHVTVLQPYTSQGYLLIDRATQRNLELVEPLFTGGGEATLLKVLDETVTPMGSRLLREWILRPLTAVDPINARLDAINVFVDDHLLLYELREILGAVKDLERTVSRLTVGSANARDLLLLHRGLSAMPLLRQLLAANDGSERLNALRDQVAELPQLVETIGQAIVDEPPVTVKEGGIIREGHHELLDELRRAASEGKTWIAELQTREQQATGIKSLKVRYNKVFGYFIEVSKSNLAHVPEHYLRKQTLVNAERFITPELKEIEDKVLGAEDKSKALEYELFQALREQVVGETACIQRAARAIAELDVLGSLAEVALKRDYCRPEVAEGLELHIAEGRHPVIDAVRTDERFVPNDVTLNGHEQQLLIITGPNMAGKSTYIRQVALLTLMAQMGSYLPAAAAHVGLTDRIFTRVGAADDLSRGQSTFMVEMLETANILNNATRRSLIVLDEIGRGTSTYDGLSIAWAVAEHLHNRPELRPRTLFATHYHELTQLADTLPGVANFNVAVREQGDKVIFLHKILPGPADRSYGIHVARLAGLPRPVVDRANEVLANLEGNARDEITHTPKLATHRRRRKVADDDHPSLFDP